jgi:hypothetical protein
MTLFRIATVKVTGKKYLVSYIDFRANKVVCHGEVTRFRGLQSWHEGTKAFLLDVVDIAPEAPKTVSLMTELWNQGIASKRAEGYDIEVRHTRRGNVRATNYGKVK